MNIPEIFIEWNPTEQLAYLSATGCNYPSIEGAVAAAYAFVDHQGYKEYTIQVRHKLINPVRHKPT